MYRVMGAAIAAAMMLTIVPATAIEIPLSGEAAEAAIAAETAAHGLNASTLPLFAEWDLNSHALQRTPSLYIRVHIATPFERLMSAAAFASARYEPVPQALIRAETGSRKLTLLAYTTSKVTMPAFPPS